MVENSSSVTVAGADRGAAIRAAERIWAWRRARPGRCPGGRSAGGRSAGQARPRQSIALVRHRSMCHRRQDDMARSARRIRFIRGTRTINLHRSWH